MEEFREIVVKHMEKLELYVPVVAKVHGASHPEFYEVRILFDAINKKITEAGSGRPELAEEFESLRKVTSDYTVPTDTCESYEAVYDMLKEWDEAYQC